MGEGRKLIAGCLAALAMTFLAADFAAASPRPNPWQIGAGSIYNMAHQGGEVEAPSSTIYAFRTALEDRGADSLEMDVNASADGHLMVMHDYYTSRITPLDAQVRELTLAELQALDAAWWFSPGHGQFNHSLPVDQYPLRGVRTGDVPPPEGFEAEDFRIPTIEEVLTAFPGVPMNIEIKTVPGEPSESIRVANLLAAVLKRRENINRQVIVASQDQAALVRFHELLPSIGVSASVTSMIGLIGGGAAISPEPIALQVPNRLGELDPPKILQEMNPGYPVHAWTSEREDENDAVYGHLIEAGVSGIISSAPSRLADYLCRAGVRHPGGSPRCDSQLLNYRLKWPSRSLRKLLLGQFPVRINCHSDCHMRLQVKIGKRAAKRRGIIAPGPPDKQGMLLIGGGRLLAPKQGAGRRTYRASVFGKPFRRLARIRKVKLEMTAWIFDGYGARRAIQRRWLTLDSKRPLRRGR